MHGPVAFTQTTSHASLVLPVMTSVAGITPHTSCVKVTRLMAGSDGDSAITRLLDVGASESLHADGSSAVATPSARRSGQFRLARLMSSSTSTGATHGTGAPVKRYSGVPGSSVAALPLPCAHARRTARRLDRSQASAISPEPPFFAALATTFCVASGGISSYPLNFFRKVPRPCVSEKRSV